MQRWKRREWKHWHDFAGVENAGVEVIELQQNENLLNNFQCRLIWDNCRNDCLKLNDETIVATSVSNKTTLKIS